MPQYRLIQQSYYNDVESEDGPGSLSNVVERDGGQELLWSGTCDTQPDSEWFTDMGIVRNENNNYGFGASDAEYSYELQILKGNKWSYCDKIFYFERLEADQDDLTV